MRHGKRTAQQVGCVFHGEPPVKLPDAVDPLIAAKMIFSAGYCFVSIDFLHYKQKRGKHQVSFSGFLPKRGVSHGRGDIPIL